MKRKAFIIQIFMPSAYFLLLNPVTAAYIAIQRAIEFLVESFGLNIFMK